MANIKFSIGWLFSLLLVFSISFWIVQIYLNTSLLEIATFLNQLVFVAIFSPFIYAILPRKALQFPRQTFLTWSIFPTVFLAICAHALLNTESVDVFISVFMLGASSIWLLVAPVIVVGIFRKKN